MEWKSKIVVAGLVVLTACVKPDRNSISISSEVLKDKIAGGWAGKMIGVTYGAPTEFRAQGKTYEDPITWSSADIKGSIWQDDLYVQLTFLMTMDKYGVDAPAVKFQEMLAKAGYPLWHANVQARKNYFDSIFPPRSGNPEFNVHADDIDFQIESDYIGFMCPGMPQKALEICNKIGHIMNYGDGVYGGIFVAALYAEAFFSTSIPDIINNALQAIPAKSDYALVVQDVISLHKQYPADWRAAWSALEQKWGHVDICGAGSTFNIDAKLNGAYIVMGLLYGDGDPMKTMEISTRCGQDSDCNPSNAMAVLGVMKGFSNLPDSMKSGIMAVADSVFINTSYSFNEAVESTHAYAVSMIKDAGGTVSGDKIKIRRQVPVAPPLEVSFPNMVFDYKTSIFDSEAWKLKGNWRTFQTVPWNEEPPFDQSKFADHSGDELEFAFNGTGIVLMGNWVKDGGKAAVYIDGKPRGTIDTYYCYGNQEHYGINLFHVFGLSEGDHSLKLMVKGEKRAESEDTKVYITEALVFQSAP